jgi:predicted Ser/Thr protein kinase
MTETYLPAGSVLADRYEVAHEIGRGGFSVVYKARDRRTDTDVAIKLLVPPPAAARVARERVRREVQAVRQLQHPNIVGVYDVGDSGPWSFVVMALVDGPDLAVRVRSRGVLDDAAAAQAGRDVAGALEAAHARGILHRDVKPQNILLAHGRALLTDFGSARLAGQSTLTQTGGMIGTPAFAAPELAAGLRGDGRSDIYSLGLTLFYALTGELPFRAAPGGAGQGSGDGYHVRDRKPDVEPWLDAAIACATAADPDDRFPSAALFALALSPEGAESRAAGAGSTGAGRDRCVLCRAPDPFGLGVCPRCARGADADQDVLVFLERTSPGTPRRLAEEALDARIGSWTSAAARASVVQGERPLLRVPATAGARLLDLLDAQGLVAHTQPVMVAWRSDVPPPIMLLGALVAMVGVLSGWMAGESMLALSGPLMGVGLVTAGAMARRTPVWNPPPGALPVLGAEASLAAARTLAALPRGEARRLLVDLLRRAGAARDQREISSLIVAACAAAQDMAALEQQLHAGESGLEMSTDHPPALLDALSRCEQGRDLLAQRLLEASASLSRWQASSQTMSVGANLHDLAQALSEEARIQNEAAAEIAELLKPGNT